MPKKITQQEYNEYEKLLKKYQRMRRRIIKSHDIVTKSSSKSTSRLPQLVAPERQTKTSLKSFRLTGRRIFNLKMRQLRRMVSEGARGFYKEIKREYLNLWKKWIFDDEKPSGVAGRYSMEQINMSGDRTRQAMLLYNKMVALNPTLFVYMRDREMIKAFRYYYNEFSERGLAISESFIEDTEKYIDMLNKTPKEQKELLKAYFEGKGGNLDMKIISEIVSGRDFSEETLKAIQKGRRTFRPHKVASSVASRKNHYEE